LNLFIINPGFINREIIFSGSPNNHL
jgi:hypothetical protein